LRRSPGSTPRWLPVALFAVTVPVYLKSLAAASLCRDEAREANFYCGFEPSAWSDRPLLYTAGERAMARLFGPHEAALRLLPCLAALLAVAVTYRVARRGLSRGAAVLAAGILAIAPPFLTSSHKVGSYAFDALFAALLVHLYQRFRDERTVSRLTAYGLAAALSFFFSLPSVLVVGGLALYEAAAEELSWTRLWRFAACHAALAAVFLAVYAASFSGGARRAMIAAYFSDAYSPSRVPAHLPWWSLEESARIVVEQSGAALPFLAASLAAVGLWAAWRRTRVVAAGFVLILFLNVAASAFERYPFGVTPLAVYLAPLVALLVAHGASHLASRGRIAAAIAALAVTAAFAPAVPLAVSHLRTGWHREETRDLVAAIEASARPGDAIYVNEDAVPAFEFYWRRSGRAYPPEGFLIGGRAGVDSEERALEVDRLAEASRVWSLLTHVSKTDSDAFVDLMQQRFMPSEARIAGDARLDRWSKARE
jgi:Dolichyl-phosphate-mannose-protein mannosyltransferase